MATALERRQKKRIEQLREVLNELANAACDIHPTAPSSASIDRLHAAIVAADQVL